MSALRRRRASGRHDGGNSIDEAMPRCAPSRTVTDHGGMMPTFYGDGQHTPLRAAGEA
jgi:hypothetical protein